MTFQIAVVFICPHQTVKASHFRSDAEAQRRWTTQTNVTNSVREKMQKQKGANKEAQTD